MSVSRRVRLRRRRRDFLFAATVTATALLALAFMGPKLVRTRAAAETAPTGPRGVHQAFAAAFNARDIESMLALYEPDAAVVPEPGQVVTGSKNIRAAMERYLELDSEIRIETIFVIQTGEIALTGSRRKVRGGGEITTSSGVEVMRRGSNGIWRLVVDNPYGGQQLN